MDKLSLMFDAKQFAAAFDAARDNSSTARSEPDVVMWLEDGVGAAAAGFAWGHGQMSFQGRNHPFRVSSPSIADAGAAGIYATGRVMRLRKISDFSGKYSASSAGVTISGGSFAAYLENERGVVIELVARDAATTVIRSVNGLRVRLRNV